MNIDRLLRISNEHNDLLAQFVRTHNVGNPTGTPMHIYDLSIPPGVDNLRKQGYGVFTSTGEEVGLANPYLSSAGVETFADRAIRDRVIAYDRSIAGTTTRNAALSALVGARVVQRGICAGVNPNLNSTGDTEFEVHDFGNEGLIPIMFSNLTIITHGYDPIKKTIDLSTAVAVYMPSGNHMIYCLSPQDGHYAPHGVAFIMEVLLPDGTNRAELDENEKAVNSGGIIYTAHNKVLASSRGKDGTTVQLVGEAKAIEVIRAFQEQAVKKIRPDLERLLSVR